MTNHYQASIIEIVSITGDTATDLALHKIASDVRSIESSSFNQKECAPAAHIRGLPYELIARRNKLAGLSV